MAEFDVQQKATINNYRSTHKLGFVVTDEYIAELIKKEMEQTGVVYAGFESLAKSVAKSQIKQPIQNTDANVKTNATASIFGTQIVDNEFDLGFSGKTTNTYPEIQPTESQSEAINFLKDITSDAETTFKNREDEAGALSTVVNTWQEVFNKQYAKSTVKKELQAAKEDLKLLEQASKGQVGYTDFLGNTHIRSFEDVFKQRRGVKFNEQAVADCTEKAEQFAAIKTSVEMINQTKQTLGYTTKGDVHSHMNPQEASSAIIKAFQLSGINSLDEMNKTLQDIEQKYKNHPDIQKYGGKFRFAKNNQGQYVIYRIAKNGYPAEATNEQLIVIAKEMGLRLDKALATALGVEYSANATLEEMANLTQQTYDKYQKEYEDSFAKAYGKKDVKALAEAYVLKQQQGVANIEMGLNIASMALMVVPSGVVATSGWALKGALLAKRSATGAKVVKGLQLVDKAKTFVKGAQTLQKVSQVASPFIMANMTLRPTELLEQLTSKNGMSAEEWKTWEQGVLQNSIYMAAGMGASKLAETGAAMYKTKALVSTLKSAGKSTDEIIAMVKANPVKFPNEIVKSLSKVDTLAKTLQVSSEVALDIGSTVLINKAMGNGDLLPQDVINSIAFAISGGVLQKQFAPLSTEAKVSFIEKALKEYGITKVEAERILKTMDDISAGKVRAKDVKPLDDYHDTQMLDEVVVTARSKKTTTETDLVILLDKATSQDDFRLIYEEINKMPEGELKASLMQKYSKKLEDYSLQIKIRDVENYTEVKGFAKPVVTDYKNIKEASRLLHKKIKTQTGFIEIEKIEKWITNLSGKYEISETEVLEIMSRLTQFGNYAQLSKLGDEMSKLGIGSFYEDSSISANSAFIYIQNKKKQFELKGNKQAFVLDNQGLEHIKKMNLKERESFISKINNGELVLINLDGTGLQVGNNNYSYTLFEGDANLEALTEAAILQFKEGKDLNDVLNKSLIDKACKILGNDIKSQIQTIKIEDSSIRSASSIANQINPQIPSAERIQIVIEQYVTDLKNKGELTDEERKILLTKYIDNMTYAYSNVTFAKLLRNKHLEIEKYVKSLGKTMDDVIFICPDKNKSFSLINYMYSKVNNIEESKFVIHDFKELQKGKVVVVLDDIAGSGNSMLRTKFHYNDFKKNNRSKTVIFAPITASKVAIELFEKSKNSADDYIIVDDNHISDYSKFTGDLSEQEQKSDCFNFRTSAQLCIAFPYMIPDNSSDIAGLLFANTLNSTKANKALPDKNLLNKINTREAEYIVLDGNNNVNNFKDSSHDVLISSSSKPFTPQPRPELIAEAVKIDGVVKPELENFAKELQAMGYPDDMVAKHVNWNKTKEGSYNKNLLPIYKKAKELRLSNRDNIEEFDMLIKYLLTSDGKINQINFEALDFLHSEKMSIDGMLEWFKLANDGEGNFNKEIYNNYLKLFEKYLPVDKQTSGDLKSSTIDVDVSILVNSIHSKPNYISKSDIALIINNCLTENGTINQAKLDRIFKYVEKDISWPNIMAIISFAKDMGQDYEQYFDIALEIKNISGQNVSIVGTLNAISDNGVVNPRAFEGYKKLVGSNINFIRINDILNTIKDSKGCFNEQNYKYVEKFLKENETIDNIKINSFLQNMSESKNPDGVIVKEYFDAVNELKQRKITDSGIKFIMFNTKKRITDAQGNTKDSFDSKNYRAIIKILDKLQQLRPDVAIKSTHLYFENNQVFFVICYEDGMKKKLVYDSNLVKLNAVEVDKAKNKNDKASPRVIKRRDRSNLTSKRTLKGLESIQEQTVIVKDANGKPVRYEHYSQSDVPGVFDVRVRDAMTGETKVISSAKVDSETGFTLVQKDMESIDGTRTLYHYEDDPQGNRIIDYKIIDKDGNILMDDSQTFEVLSDNHFVSTYNDKIYETVLSEDKLIVSCKNDGRKVEFSLEDFIVDKTENKVKLINLLKQLSGDELFDLHKNVDKLRFLPNKMKSCFNHSARQIDVGDDITVLTHESGHAKHRNNTEYYFYEVNPEIQKIYDEELANFKKVFSDNEQEYIGYFIDPNRHNNKFHRDFGPIMETIAEANSLLNTYYHSPELAMRAQYLQQYFPKTIAMISKAMRNSDYLLRVHENDVLEVKAVKTPDGKTKHILTEETDAILKTTAENLANSGMRFKRYIEKVMINLGFGADDTQIMTSRVKSVTSLYDKLKNYALDNVDKSKTVLDAMNDVRDLIGLRTVVKNQDFSKHPDVVKLISEGKVKEAKIRAAELQSEPTLNKIKAMIDEVFEGKQSEVPKILKISNYVGKDGIPYLSANQLADLKWYAEKRGVKLDYVVRAPEYDPKFSQMVDAGALSNSATKVRESGYTALQMNFEMYGKTFEWQFRGEEINRFAEAEHIPYDLRTNKDITSAYPELEIIYNPIKELLSTDAIDDDMYISYNQYLTNYYKYLRDLELGFSSIEPKLSDYGDFDIRLSAKNLELLHEYAEKIKSSKGDYAMISKLFDEYKQNLVNN